MKLFTRSLAIAFAIALVAPSAYAGSLNLELQGITPALGQDWGYGSKGLYLGDDWSAKDHMYTNFTWDTVGMEIKMNGDATISGIMTRGDGSEWGLNIELTEIQYIGDFYKGSPHIYDELLWDLKQYGENGEGLEWKNVSMSLDAPYDTSVPEDGWVGFAMPDMGHYNPAELHLKDGKIIFDAWYKNPGNNYCGKKKYCYNVGDSKAKVKHMSKPIPEPTAALVFATGLLVTGGAARRRR